MLQRALYVVSIFVVIAAPFVAPPRAQNAHNDGQRPASGPAASPMNPLAFHTPGLVQKALVICDVRGRCFESGAPKEAPDTWCQYSVSAIDKVVCANRALLQRHNRVDDMERSLQNAAGFPTSLRVWQLHREWLDDRKQCGGPDLTACLARLYDARIEELTDAIAREEQSKH